jgi:hypothetical protein
LFYLDHPQNNQDREEFELNQTHPLSPSNPPSEVPNNTLVFHNQIESSKRKSVQALTNTGIDESNFFRDIAQNPAQNG